MGNSQQKKSKPPAATKAKTKSYDVVVIGAGIGGLTATALLALKGKSVSVVLILLHLTNPMQVLLLEQKAQGPAGCLSSYQSPGLKADWPLGVHFVGGRVWDKTSDFGALMDKLAGGRLQWEMMPYDIMTGPDRSRRPFPTKLADLEAGLEHQFAESKADIEAWDAYIRQANEACMSRLKGKSAAELSTETWAQTLDKFNLKHPALRMSLSIQCSVAALTPDLASTTLLAFSAEYYREGSAYPIGGPMAIFNNIVQTITDNKGEVRFGAPVAEVLVENGVVDGVKLKDGTLIKSKAVISTVGAHHTFCNLVPRINEGLQLAHDELSTGQAPMSTSACMICIALKPRDDYPKSFFYHLEPGKTPVYISFMSSRDPDYRNRNPDTCSCELSTRMTEEIFGMTDEQLAGKVASTKEELMKIFSLQFPDFVDSIIDTYVLTPKQMQQELGSFHGSLYGMAQVPSRLQRKWLVESPLPGLHLGGADIFCPGLYGAALGSVLAVDKVSQQLG